MRQNEAIYRADGVAQGPDGSLYISDSQKGASGASFQRCWRSRVAQRSSEAEEEEQVDTRAFDAPERAIAR